jgi:hypothetical protein
LTPFESVFSVNTLIIVMKGAVRMRVCEICGTKEEIDTKGNEECASVILHICESCREDQKWSGYENWLF